MMANSDFSRLINTDILHYAPFDKDITDYVDLTVTSPPYNYKMDYGQIDDDIPYQDYLIFTTYWLDKLLHYTKPDGRLCLNVPIANPFNTVTKGQRIPIYSDILRTAINVGWCYHTTILWYKNSAQRSTAWGSWCSAKAPSVLSGCEMIIVLFKDQWSKEQQGESDITPDEFKNIVHGVWRINGEVPRKVGHHPAAFPLELPERCIKLFSYIDDVVFDPFAGSGTTLLAARLNNRIGVGLNEIRKLTTGKRNDLSNY